MKAIHLLIIIDIKKHILSQGKTLLIINYNKHIVPPNMRVKEIFVFFNMILLKKKKIKKKFYIIASYIDIGKRSNLYGRIQGLV